MSQSSSETSTQIQQQSLRHNYRNSEKGSKIYRPLICWLWVRTSLWRYVKITKPCSFVENSGAIIKRCDNKRIMVSNKKKQPYD